MGQPTRLRSVLRFLVPVVLVGVSITVLALFAFPTRTWLDQRAAAASAQQRLAELDAENAAAERELEALRTDEEIERIAREQFGYARNGDEIYRVLPEPEPPVRVPESWPFTGLGPILAR